MNDRREREGGRRKLGALVATSLALTLVFLGLIVWAWLTANPGRRVSAEPPGGAGTGIVVALPMPLTNAPPETPVLSAPQAASQTSPSTTENGAAATTGATIPDAPPATSSLPEVRTSPAMPAVSKEVALVAVPNPELTEESRWGPLPRIGADGRKPWQAYARPFDRGDERPRIVIVIGNLGISSAVTEAAIEQLPGAVTLAFSPYSHNLDRFIPLAREAGHEILLSMPMEPTSYPTNDPGPQALLTKLSPSDNLERLNWQLARFAGYVGVTNYMGSRFTSSERDIRPILEELNSRGLLFFDSRSGGGSVAGRIAAEIGMPTSSNGRFIDADPSPSAIDSMLETVEDEAKQKGSSIAMGFPYSVTIERVAEWTRSLPDKGILLAPVSAVVNESKKGN